MRFTNEDEKVLRVLQLSRNPKDKNKYWIAFVTVHPKHRKKSQFLYLKLQLPTY